MWTDVKTALPENGVTVAVILDESGTAYHKKVAAAYCWNGRWTLVGTSLTVGVSHWALMPKAPSWTRV